jgi:hypothetical protein
VTFVVDGQRQPKPPPLEDLILLLHPQPLVRILEGDVADAAWNAWQDTTPDNFGVV